MRIVLPDLDISRVKTQQIPENDVRGALPGGGFRAKNPGISTFGQFHGEWNRPAAVKSILRILEASGMMHVKYGGRPMAESIEEWEKRFKKRKFAGFAPLPRAKSMILSQKSKWI